MAKIDFLAPKIARWEGGFVNDKVDKGGATNMGITLGSWKQVGYDKDGDGDIDEQDIKLLTSTDFKAVLKKYWDRWQADKINNQSVAEILVDWVWGSGKWGIIIPQRLLGVNDDGIVGNGTLTQLNNMNQKELHQIIFNARMNFLDNIVKNNASQEKFIKGWKNRLNDFKFIEK